MPVILTTPEECEAWLTPQAAQALALQRPLPDDVLRVVAKGEKQDAGRRTGDGARAIALTRPGERL